MTVYVDDAITLWRGQRWAHLMADTLDELHAMAARLSIPPRAFQNPMCTGPPLDAPALPDESWQARDVPWSTASDSRGLEQTIQLDSRLAVLQPLGQHP